MSEMRELQTFCQQHLEIRQRLERRIHNQRKQIKLLTKEIFDFHGFYSIHRKWLDRDKTKLQAYQDKEAELQELAIKLHKLYSQLSRTSGAEYDEIHSEFLKVAIDGLAQKILEDK